MEINGTMKVIFFIIILVFLFYAVAIVFNPYAGNQLHIAKEASNLVSNQVNIPGEIQTTRILTGDAHTSTIESVALASGVITTSQLCFGPGDAPESIQVQDEGDALQYAGGQKIRISVLCNYGGLLSQDLQKTGIAEEWVNTPKCHSVMLQSNMGCLIIPRKG